MSDFHIGTQVFRYDCKGDLEPAIKKVHRITQRHVILDNGERYTHNGSRVRDFAPYDTRIEIYTPERETALQVRRRRAAIIHRVKLMEDNDIQILYGLLREYGWRDREGENANAQET